MFSGIVEEAGIVTGIRAEANLSHLRVRAGKVSRGIKTGASIAVNGVCLTVTSVNRGVMQFDIMRETLIRTTLGALKVKDKVNLERALKVDGRIDGHFVTGHVDAVGRIVKKRSGLNYSELKISKPRGIARYIAPRGSVCIDGASLTVGNVGKTTFSVHLIPYTGNMTTLGSKGLGDPVNIETDILAKYILNKGPWTATASQRRRKGDGT